MFELSPKLHFRAADKNQECPLCGHQKYCWLGFNDTNEIVKVTCQWTTEQPEGWHSKGHSTDGRPVWERNGFRRRRQKYPNLIELEPQHLNSAPQWKGCNRDGSPKPGDYISIGGVKTAFFLGWEKEGKKNFAKYGDTPNTRIIAKAQDQMVELATTDGDATEQEIEYFYPRSNGNKLGMVRRWQWTDRRYVYADSLTSPLKKKRIRPFHWVGSQDEGKWVSGTGREKWPLYRESEALAEIAKGGYVFAVGGEQAVEACRALGLVATSPQGGEAKYRQIIDRLLDAFKDAKTEGKKPLLVAWPDNDITGDDKFGKLLVRDAQNKAIPCVALNPTEIWPQCPPGGDVHDWVSTGVGAATIRDKLANGVDLAIERQEQDEATEELRKAWKAPASNDGELGRWVRNKAAGEDDPDEFKFIPQTNFDLWIEQELASEEGGGLLLKMKRSDDRDTYRIFLKSSEYTSLSKFEDALKRALGSNILCTLSINEVKALIRARLLEYHRNRKGKVYRLIDRVGQQSNGVWVFEHGQLTPQGQPTTENESLQVWNSQMIQENNIPSPKIADPDPQALPYLAQTMRSCLGKNFMQGLLTLGYVAAGCHYQTIMKQHGAFPILNLWGNAGTGKSIIAGCGLSLVGMDDAGMMRDMSISAAYERLKLAGSLTHCLDDPKRTPELDEFLKGFYNGKPRIVRGKEVAFNIQTPHSPLMVTSNFSAGDRNAATMSRILSVWCGKFEAEDRTAFHTLREAQRRASGSLPDLIKLGYPKDDIEALELELLPFLPKAHARVCNSLALVYWYTRAVAKLAGLDVEEQLWSFILDFAEQANQSEQSGSYLPDFLNKLEILRSEDKVGEWNLREVSLDDGEHLAVYLPGVWKVFDSEFRPEYNENVIKALLIEGGARNSKQRFHKNETSSRQWQAGNLKGHVEEGEKFIPKGPPPSSSRRCLLIPAELFPEAEMSTGRQQRQQRQQDAQNLDREAVPAVDTFLNGMSTETEKRQQDGSECIQTSNPVDAVDTHVNGGGTASNPDIEGVSNPVDAVDTVFRKTSTSKKTHPPIQITPQCIVVIKASAKRIKHGSSKLDVSHADRWAKGKKQLHMDDLKKVAPEVWKSLQQPCTVKAVKQDRVQVVCSAGKVHVFNQTDVAVLPKSTLEEQD